MKHPNLITYIALFVLVALSSGCSASEENSGSSNTNASQTTNSNAAPQPQISQGNPATAVPPSVQPIPAPAPGEQSKVAGNADAAATSASTDNPRAPKLVIPAKKVDFGKQPQDKTLVRAIVVKNGGREDLKIESVVPS
jgi:hypothetical protein